MKALILIAALCLPDAALADSDSFSISADQWALPRSGSALLHLAPFSEIGRASCRDRVYITGVAG